MGMIPFIMNEIFKFDPINKKKTYNLHLEED